MRTHLDADAVRQLVNQLIADIAEQFDPTRPLNIVGVRTRGETLADRLMSSLLARGFMQIGRGVLDITLYRDDLQEVGPLPVVGPTSLDVPIDGVPLLVVDDVIHTGRSMLAALALLRDFGRPSVVKLAVLVDRGGRELPIQPDIIALKLPDVPPKHRVNVRLEEIDGRDEVLVEQAA